MPVTETPRLGFKKQALHDQGWDVALDEGFDNADARFLLTGNASPVLAVAGNYVGQKYLQIGSTQPRWFFCAQAGAIGVANWEPLLSNVGWNITMQNGIPLEWTDSIGFARNGLVLNSINKFLLGATTNALLLRGTTIKADVGAGEVNVWHADNDGAASGLDADLLDGIQGAEYLALSGASYFSSPATLVPVLPGTNTSSHGFGTVPRAFGATLNCIGANNGYAIGDVLNLANESYNDSINVAGVSVFANATNVGVSWATTNGIYITNRAGGALFSLASALSNWRLRLFAWK